MCWLYLRRATLRIVVSQLQFESSASLNDIKAFLQRVSTVGHSEAMLVARPQGNGRSVLAVYGCVIAPTSILDNHATVLVMRAARLEGDITLDTVVEIQALMDRFARLNEEDSSLPVPPTTAHAVWAGIKPPVGGWEPVGVVDVRSLQDVARDGMQRVSEALPDSPGAAVVEKVRSQIWQQEIMPDLPAAVALAGETLGFLDDQPVARLLDSHGWSRLSFRHGDVLVRRKL